MKFVLALLLVMSTVTLNGFDVVVRTPDGEISTVIIPDQQSVAEFHDTLQCIFGEDSFCIVDVIGIDRKEFIRKAGIKRNYDVPATSSQRKDIAYIVNTLGNASLVKIAKERSSLKKAGDRLELLHPFHFVGTIFSDDEMKTSVHALRQRGWVWGDFFEGINSSMTEEQRNNNILPYVNDFANRVGIDPNLIYPSLSAGNWKEFVNVLLEKIPRNTNNNRYQM